ncbi:hypothetical protein D5086_000995 [Populus alba]|uniref:Uncharacterized protein n=1 Tax=Populus alba TaxID=43335 RepID=A0ACC4CZ09_POPAL
MKFAKPDGIKSNQIETEARNRSTGLVEMLSELNPMVEQFAPPSLANHDRYFDNSWRRPICTRFCRNLMDLAALTPLFSSVFEIEDTLVVKGWTGATEASGELLGVSVNVSGGAPCRHGRVFKRKQDTEHILYHSRPHILAMKI